VKPNQFLVCGIFSILPQADTGAMNEWRQIAEKTCNTQLAASQRRVSARSYNGCNASQFRSSRTGALRVLSTREPRPHPSSCSRRKVYNCTTSAVSRLALITEDLKNRQLRVRHVLGSASGHHYLLGRLPWVRLRHSASVVNRFIPRPKTLKGYFAAGSRNVAFTPQSEKRVRTGRWRLSVVSCIGCSSKRVGALGDQAGE
jgi:hypothetical protein